ncbi:hypothetical protein SUGI_0915480 [Cryptomeria japonica]|nr:hypothetical protein SUGI_0915480 [Cryptomeria japonica]
MVQMKNGINVFLLFLLLTAPFAFASESHLDYNPHNGYCASLSGGFHGPCMEFREDECNDACKTVDHQVFGECDSIFICWCYHLCDK